MAATAFIPIEVYLRTVYEPDAELVGGEVEQRKVGEYLRNLAQRAILFRFFQHESEWQIGSIQEQRTRLPWGFEGWDRAVCVPQQYRCVFSEGLRGLSEIQLLRYMCLSPPHSPVNFELCSPVAASSSSAA